MRKIKKAIKKIVCYFLPIKKLILFESFPDLSDNTKAVFDEMLKRGLNKRYKMIWLLYKPYTPKEKIEGVKYFYANTKFKRFQKNLYLLQARCSVCCNGFLTTQRKGQVSFYLAHGVPIKQSKGYYTVPNSIDYGFTTGEGVKELHADTWNYDVNKVQALGFPRNDVFNHIKKDVKETLHTDCDKVIVWYPTFRQHSSGVGTGAKHALPILHDSQKAQCLNEIAKNNNVLIVLKPHFAQDLRYIKDLGLSNIRFITDSFFAENDITSYEFVGGCDALLTDYSSIYYDFTLCDKPVAVIWEDIEEYKTKDWEMDVTFMGNAFLAQQKTYHSVACFVALKNTEKIN